MSSISSNRELLLPVVHSFEFVDEGLPRLKPLAFKMSERLSRPYTLKLRLAATEPNIDESALLGQSCTLTLTRGGLLRYVHGIVTDALVSGTSIDAFTPEENLPNGVVHLVIAPAVALLNQRINSRVFQNIKVTDVLKQVLGEALGDYGRKVTLKTSRDYQELEYCTQYEETDSDFVQRLMATEGIMSYFVHRENEKVEELVLFDEATQYPELMTLDHGKVSFETSPQAGQSAETVSIFNARGRLTPTTVSMRAFNWSRAAAPDDSSATGKDGLKRQRELYLGEARVGLRALRNDGTYATTSAATQVKLIQEVERSRGSLCCAWSNVTGLTPGTVFDLDNAAREELNRKYLVVHVEHQGSRPGDAERGSGSAAGDADEVLYSNTFECVPSDVLLRLPRPPRRVIQTMQTALVVGDEDVTTDIHGRIKVQFHWDRHGKNDRRSSCWVRVAQSSAGMGFGCVFIPRKGQEVVVAFLDGDPDKPLVIGSVHNGINSPPYELPTEKTRSVIRTRSTPDSDGYNEISFEDAKDSEQLYVRAQRDLKKLVRRDDDVTVGNDQTVKVTRHQTEEIGENQKLTVKQTRTVNVGGDHNVTVEKSQIERVKSAYELTTDEKYQLTQGETSLTFASNAVSLDAAGAVHFKRGPAELKMDEAGKVVLSSPVGISLECGGNTLQLLPDGLELNGIKISCISGPAALELGPTGAKLSSPMTSIEGTATCAIAGSMVTLNS